MKAHVSRRPLLSRLDICLVLCCFYLLIGSRECNARTNTQDTSDSEIKPVHEDFIKSSLPEASRINEELKAGDEVDVLTEKRLRRVTETADNFDKNIANAEEKDKTVRRDVENDRKIEVGETVERRLKESQDKHQQKGEQKTFKRIFKSPFRRLKRSDQLASQEKLQIAENFGKSANDKRSEIHDYVEQNKKIDVEGIRRLDINIEEEEKKGIQNVLKINSDASEGVVNSVEIKSNVNDNVQYEKVRDTEQGRIQENESKNINIESNDEAFRKIVIAENPIVESSRHVENPTRHLIDVLKDKSSHEKSEGILNDLKETPDDNDKKIASSRAETLSRLQFLKNQALEFRGKIRNSTFLQSLKFVGNGDLGSDFTEDQYLQMLENITSKSDMHTANDLNTDILKDIQLNDIQTKILKCTQQLLTKKERQSFLEDMTECIRGLDVLNCMRIFILPIIIENMPAAITQAIPNLPIEVNLANLFPGNRDKLKSSRQVPLFNLYMKPIDADTIVFEILTDGLMKSSSNENLPSFIEAKNETFSKLLTCNKMQLLQMSEKFLPESERKNYSDEMLSCIRRFEYFSCMKYFSWPTIRKYYPALPQFPLSDSYLSSLMYPNYPLIPYPGFEGGFGHLPEIVDSGPARMRPETIILHLFRKTLNVHSRVPTPPTPMQFDYFVKNQIINPEQMATIHLAEQLLPVQLREAYVSRMFQCIRQFDYYNCMRYVTWPAIRDTNPSFPSFQDIIDNFQLPQLPNIPNLFDLFSQFQLPQFPQFQLPEVPNFSLPDFSAFIPFGQQTTTTTAKPAVDSPPDPVSEEKKSNMAIESNIYKILKNVRDSMGATPLSHPTYTNRKVFLFPLMTEEQTKIFALAESIVPPIDREIFITSMYFCLNDKNTFSTCTRTIIWPSLRNYIKGLPEFPTEDPNLLEQKIRYNMPAIPYTGSGDNFFIMRELEKFFFEGREDTMKYIIRSIQLAPPNSLNMQRLLEILRSIQFNTPEFLTSQMIQYPRAPEAASIITQDQENIIHAVESLLPEETRQKFYNDMIDCMRRNKFPICSRNIIFPSIYRYFQNALSIPNNYMMTEKNNSSRIHPLHIETKVNAEKQEENTPTMFDRKFSPLYTYPPELVILSILRQFQMIGTPPDFPTESIAYTPEFRKAYTLVQQHTLIIAEGILPDEYRKGFLQEMYRCNQKDTFLNCTRDIMFPTMKKAYAEFPDFPDFENDLNRSKMLSIIDSLNTTTFSSKSYEFKKTLPSMEALYKFLPEDKNNKLKMLVDKLPDTLYYSLYMRMTQCIQYSDSISCSHDIVYPVLKQYYDAAGFNIDDYYPITAQSPFYSTMESLRSPYDYEIICENMGFICTLLPFGTRNAEGLMNFNANISPSDFEASYTPFGKLSDGSRIFKRSQDIWSSNFTPSVGAGKTVWSSTGESSVNYINFAVDPMYSFPVNRDQNLQNHPVNSLRRNKRNVDDLLDSYPDAIPFDKKNSVPRRIPPKSTFPNITESELLQILVHLSKYKNEPLLDNGDILSNEYFVDSLNDTERSLITADQYEILKFVQGLNSETAKASFMSRLFQCIKSLSFLRCVGIFVWPMIASNLPSLPFNFSDNRDTRAVEEIKIKDMFGVSSSEFEIELMNRKEQIESNFIEWYKTLTENKFEKYLGPLKIIGRGSGELGIKFAGYREGRLSKLKDNKNLPSILTIITDVIEEVFDTKPDKTKNKKEHPKNEKRGRSLSGFEESNGSNDNFKRAVKDDQVVNMLLERLRPSVSDVKDEDMKHYFSLEDAYRAFQVLFGPKISSKIVNQLKSMNHEHFKNYERDIEDLKLVDELNIVPLEIQEKIATEKLKRSRAMNGFDKKAQKSNDAEKDTSASEDLSRFKSYVAEYIKRVFSLNKKNFQTGLTLRLPKLKDNIEGRKITNSLRSIGRDMKKKMTQVMPAAGIAATFLVHLTLAHLKAAATVSNLLSNMALGSAMIGMVREMVFGSNDNPKIKYVYDMEKTDGVGISWPPPSAETVNRFSPPYT